MNVENVILVTIDSLRTPNLGICGHSPTPSPTLDSLCENNFFWSDCYSVGSATQFSLPGIHTSSHPLSYGGYDRGIANRPVCLAERFQQEGYRTAGFATALWAGSLFGYDRGFDEFYSFFDLERFPEKIAKIYLSYYRNLVSEGSIPFESYFDGFDPLVSELFDHLDRFCREKYTEVNERDFSTSPAVHGWDFEEAIDLVEHEREQYERNAARYLETFLDDEKPDILSQIASLDAVDTDYTRIRADLRNILNGFFLRQSVETVSEAPRLCRNDSSVFSRLNRRFDYRQSQRVPSAAYVIDRLLDWIDTSDDPFFTWTHLMDVHDVSYLSYDVREYDTIRSDEYPPIGSLLTEILSLPTYSGNPLYDLAVQYADDQLSRLLEALDARGLRDTTLVVITADHGRAFGDEWDYLGLRNATWPERTETGEMQFYDEIYHVPAIFVHPEIGATTFEKLSSSIDIPPTILNFAGLRIPAEFDGIPLHPGHPGRKFVTMENLGSGPCHFQTQTITTAVRSDNYKIVYELPTRAAVGDIRELYSLRDDPVECNNLAAESTPPADCEWLLERARERINTLKSRRA